MLVMVGVLAFVPSAGAGTGETRDRKAADAVLRPPLKDCTRFNGRIGYYGNPWCTEAEQRAWDLATERRRVK
jgi:hypothetical protein